MKYKTKQEIEEKFNNHFPLGFFDLDEELAKQMQEHIVSYIHQIRQNDKKTFVKMVEHAFRDEDRTVRQHLDDVEEIIKKIKKM
jgi:precorrin-3B methylase